MAGAALGASATAVAPCFGAGAAQLRHPALLRPRRLQVLADDSFEVLFKKETKVFKRVDTK
jgi:hypothetical protein